MKIAILTPTFYQFSGIDRVAKRDAEKYAKKHDVKVFALAGDIQPRNYKIEYLRMPKNPTLERLYRLFFFVDIIKMIKYAKLLKDFDQVISYFYPMNWLAYLAKKKYGVKYTYWNAGIAYPHLFRRFSERLYLKLFIKLVRFTVQNADSAISISKFMKKELKRETGLDSTVKYIEIDKKRFYNGIDGSRIRKKHCIKKDDFMLFYVGRISPHKGIHLLIESFNLIKKDLPNAKLIIGGKHTFGGYSKELMEMSDSSVIFPGFIADEDLPEYYAACDVYTTCSLWEGFDMPVAEAQACGKQVVAFDCCSHPEVVKKGKLVKKGDVKAFAESILSMIKK